MAQPLRLPTTIILLFALFFLADIISANATASGNSSAVDHLTGGGSLRPEDCPAKCSYRCSATSHRKPCMFFCMKCCSKCLCVPSGTYGSKEECPCYNNWKTNEGGPKCP